MNEEAFELEIGLADEALAREVEQQLRAEGVEDVTIVDRSNLVPLVPIVMAAVVGVTALAALVVWIIRVRGCQVTIDARYDPIRKDIDCRIRDGRLIVITRDDTRVDIVEVPSVVDLTAVTKAALTGGADAVRSAAQAAGARVDDTSARTREQPG